jgi:anti-sigma28 factor (negative regulator of flagellin synthesis)
MDHLDNPSTRNPVFANAGDPAESPASSRMPFEASTKTEECDAQGRGKQPCESLSQALSPDPDAASASAPAEAPADPAPAKSAQSLDNAIDDARLEKIANIKKALADGTYNVSAEELARKLIEHMLEP